MWLVRGKVLLRDNRNLSQEEFQLAQKICHRVNQLVIDRDGYVKKNQLDPLFCFPDGNWSYAKNDYYRTFQEISACRYDIINWVRLFMPFFSGYSLRHTSGLPGGPSFEEIPPKLDADIESLLKWPDEWVNRWMTLASRVPNDYIFSPPRFLGEIGWDVSGVVVNHDTCVYQERLNLLYEAGIFDWLNGRLSAKGHLRMLEIGAGYGALGYKIKSLFPACDYWICDLPESLLFSALYLSLNRPDCRTGIGDEAPGGFTFIPNYMIDKIQGEFDLVINTLSFSEMSDYQLGIYARKIKELMTDGFLFEQNQDNKHLGLTCAQEVLADYFAFHNRVTTRGAWKVKEGNPNVWANVPILLDTAVRSPKQRYAWNVAIRGNWFLSWLRRAVIRVFTLR